jgi:hypothetical protein
MPCGGQPRVEPSFAVDRRKVYSLPTMRTAKITAGGQLSIPAAVRRRWATSLVALEDQGDRLVVTPVPEDPIAAARGKLAGRIGPTTRLRSAARRDDRDAARPRG